MWHQLDRISREYKYGRNIGNILKQRSGRYICTVAAFALVFAAFE